MACLRWSPVFRKLLAKKRKHDATTDRVEDGAKARDIEEALNRLMAGAGSSHWLVHDITAAILMAGNRAEIRLFFDGLGLGAAGPSRPPRTAKQPNASPLLGRASTVQLA